MGLGIVLGGVAEGYRAERKASDEHDEAAYQQALRKADLQARKQISDLSKNSPVGQVVGSRNQGMTPAEAAAQLGLDPDTVAGLQSAQDWNTYLKTAPPPVSYSDNTGGGAATSGDTSSGAPLPAGAIPAGDTPVGAEVPATVATPAPVQSAPLPPQAAPQAAPKPPSMAAAPQSQVGPGDPLLATVGPAKAHMARTVYAAAVNQGLRPNAVQAAVIAPYFESSYDPSKSNGSSYGLYGFQKPTFTGLGGSDQTIMNPDIQIAAGIKNARGGDYYLSNILGRDATPTEIYLYHQQGPAGSKALLTADPGKPAAQALLDAGVYHNHTAAQQAINANLPNGVPENPTVGQFVGGWDKKTKALLGQVPRPAGHTPQDAPAGGNTPIPADQGGGGIAPQDPAAMGLPTTDTPAAASAAAAASEPSMTQGGLVAYETRDASGNLVVRLTSQPRYGTADDHDMAVVQILQKNGLYDKAEALQNQVLQRQLLRHQVEQGGLELDNQKRFQAAAMAAQTGDWGSVETAYNGADAAMNTGTHIRVGQGPQGQVSVGVYSNDTGQLLAVQPYKNAQDFAQQVAMLSDPKLLTQTLLQHRQLDIEAKNANTNQFVAQTGRMAEQSTEPLRRAQAGMYDADAAGTRAALPGVQAESSIKQGMSTAQGRVIQAAPGSADQARAATTVRAMQGGLPTPPQPIMVGVGQVALDPNTNTQVTGVKQGNMTVVMPVDVAASAFAQSKEFRTGQVTVARDGATGQYHYMVNGAPFDTPQAALNYLKALKASTKK